MNCRHVQPLVSARMDGEHLSSVQRDGVETHLAGCASCRTFEERSTRVRTAVRIRPAEQVPDLTESIMAGVATEAARGARRLGRRPKPHRNLMPAIAAAIAGMLVGSLVVGGPWRDGPDVASAASIAHAIRQVAPSVNAFHATYEIDEHGLDPTVPDRQLQMDVAFLAPQRFRSGCAGSDHVSVEGVDADGSHLHRGHAGDLPVRSDRMPGGARRRVPDVAHDHLAHLRVLRRRAVAGGPHHADRDLRVGGRRYGGRTRGRRRTRDGSNRDVVRPRGAAVPVPATGRHLAADVRRRPGRALARHHRLVPRAIRGIPLDGSRAASLGDALRAGA